MVRTPAHGTLGEGLCERVDRGRGQGHEQVLARSQLHGLVEDAVGQPLPVGDRVDDQASWATSCMRVLVDSYSRR